MTIFNRLLVMARKTKKPADMSALLKSSKGTLAQIASKTNSLTLLADIVRQICPDLPADAWHIANFNQNSLIIEVKSSVWGQRLQFERMNISRHLANATNGELTQIEIKVSPYRNKVVKSNEPAPEKTQKISSSTAFHLREVADNDKTPESLKQKLERLANLANR